MFKKIIAAFAALLAATAFAAVDANKASQAELEALKGIGPVISTLIINERKKGDFKDWNDMVVRVKGIGDKNAVKFSEAGLTVNGATFTGAPMAAPATPKTTAKTEKAEKPMAMPATTTTTTTTTTPVPAPAPVPARAAAATKETTAKASVPVKAGVEKAASGVKSAGATAKEAAKDEKDATKTKAEDAKEKRAAKKAEKAEMKAEKAAAAASAPMKK